MFGYLHIACPYLLHYKDAAAREASIKPIRGRKDECKPLGKRTQTWLTIAKVGDNIEIRRGSGPHARTLITYLPDDTIKIRPNRYPCNTTHQIFRRVLGRHLYFTTHDKRTWVQTYYKEEVENNTVTKQGWLPVVEELVFKWEERSNSHILVLQNPTYPKKHSINRKAANEVKRKYGYLPFRKYLSATMRLVEIKDTGMDRWTKAITLNPFFSEQAYIDLFGMQVDSQGNPVKDWKGNFRAAHISHVPVSQDKEAFLTAVRSDDAAEQYKALMQLMRYVDKTERAALHAFDNMIYKEHAGEVLEKREVRTGKLIKDPHRALIGG